MMDTELAEVVAEFAAAGVKVTTLWFQDLQERLASWPFCLSGNLAAAGECEAWARCWDEVTKLKVQELAMVHGLADVPKRIEVGDRIGTRVVTGEAGRNEFRVRQVAVKCDCGHESVTQVTVLTRGHHCRKCNGRRPGGRSRPPKATASSAGLNALTAGQCVAVDAESRMRCWGKLPCERHRGRRNTISPAVALMRLELDPIK